MRRACWLEGLGPFYTRWIIPVVDASLTLRGLLLAIASNSGFNQVVLQGTGEFPPFSQVAESKSKLFPEGKVGSSKELMGGSGFGRQ